MMNKSSANTSKRPMGSVGPAALEDAQDNPDDDLRLVVRAQGGDMRSFDTLVTRHRGRIFAMIRNMIHQEADAWDLAQEVFIKAWLALPRFEAKARFSTWLYRIAHNVVYDWTRKRKFDSVGEFNDEILARHQIDPAAMHAASAGESPDEAMAHAELRVKIEAALAKLSPEHREAVLLKDVQGLAYKEIAEVMGTSIGTVMSRLFYARQKLQSMLHHEYYAR
jgi:RNA polymerase sigma-70 factor (ECF subfamily)